MDGFDLLVRIRYIKYPCGKTPRAPTFPLVPQANRRTLYSACVLLSLTFGDKQPATPKARGRRFGQGGVPVSVCGGTPFLTKRRKNGILILAK